LINELNLYNVFKVQVKETTHGILGYKISYTIKQKIELYSSKEPQYCVEY